MTIYFQQSDPARNPNFSRNWGRISNRAYRIGHISEFVDPLVDKAARPYAAREISRCIQTAIASSCAGNFEAVDAALRNAERCRASLGRSWEQVIREKVAT